MISVFPNFEAAIHLSGSVPLPKNETACLETARELTPVYVVGLPRSGTTLLYQLLLNNFAWSYFTRWTERFFFAPVTAYSIQGQIFPHPSRFHYESKYGTFRDDGYFSKPWRPVDGNRIWQRWFPENPTHCYYGGLTYSQREQMRSTIAGFVRLSGRPFLNKNTRNSLRLSALGETFPNMILIVLRRTRVYVAQSLYIARLQRRSAGRNSNNGWWGTRPKNFLYLRQLDLLSQAVGQTRAIEEELNRQLLATARPYIEVSYETLCARPADTLKNIRDMCARYGLVLPRPRSLPSTPFPLANTVKIAPEEFALIERLLA